MIFKLFLNQKAELIQIILAFILGIGTLFNLPYFFAYFIASYSVLIKASKKVRQGDFFDENVLMSLATLGALYTGQYLEAISVMLFYRVGDFMEDFILAKTHKSIGSLLNLNGESAYLKKSGKLLKINPKLLKKGDTIVVKKGEKVPVDAVLKNKEAYFDTSSLTGESKPKLIEKNCSVLSGFSSNQVVELEVKKEFEDSTSSKIEKMIKESAKNKAPSEKFITRFAKIYTPIVFFSAFCLLLSSYFIFKQDINNSLYKACVFLVISCPCALVISIPLGFLSGILRASKENILVKGSYFLEKLAHLKIVIFDKTGTLTNGFFEVGAILPRSDVNKDFLVKLVALAESYSNHPIAKSLVKELPPVEGSLEEVTEILGLGIKSKYLGQKLLVGNKKLMQSEKIEVPNLEETTIYVALNQKYLGAMLISDNPREEASKTITKLRKLNLESIILSGDQKKAVLKLAKKLGIKKYHGNLMPKEKLLKLQQLKKTGVVAFIGDGLNDALAILNADVGIAMNGNLDAIIESSDVVLMSNKLSSLVKLIQIAKRTERIVWINIIITLSVKIIFLILGALGLANMWEAVFSDVGVTMIVILNSLHLVFTHKK